MFNACLKCFKTIVLASFKKSTAIGNELRLLDVTASFSVNEMQIVRAVDDNDLFFILVLSRFVSGIF